MKKKNNKGFSLIELIIAIAILVILTGLLAPQFMRYMEKSREAKDMQTLDAIYGAVQAALAEEEAYKVVKADTTSALVTTGVDVKTLVGIDDAFTKEVKLTLGSLDADEVWASKAITEAGKGSAVFVQIDADLKVTVWAGTAATQDGTTGVYPVEDTDVLNSTDKVNGILTEGTKFIISK